MEWLPKLKAAIRSLMSSGIYDAKHPHFLTEKIDSAFCQFKVDERHSELEVQSKK
tara:strand:- start:6 stop:170 length:165 start_codon:yes stop_codon:yes gene_type:complete